MNRLVVHQEGKRSAARAGKKGSRQKKNAWQSRHAFNGQLTRSATYFFFSLSSIFLFRYLASFSAEDRSPRLADDLSDESA